MNFKAQPYSWGGTPELYLHTSKSYQLSIQLLLSELGIL
jgi:hypothetical protein